MSAPRRRLGRNAANRLPMIVQLQAVRALPATECMRRLRIANNWKILAAARRDRGLQAFLRECFDLPSLVSFEAREPSA